MQSILYVVIRVCIGLLFLYSGITKLFDPISFTTLINAYGLIPEQVTYSAAVGLSILEVAAGIGLIFDIKGSLTAILLLLILFMMVLGYGIQMGLDIDCGCFGPQDPEAEAFHGMRTALYRDIVLLAGVLFLYYHRFQSSAVQKSISDFFSHRQARRPNNEFSP